MLNHQLEVAMTPARRRTASWLLGGLLSVAALALAGACSSGAAPSAGEETHVRVFTNGNFATGAPGAAPPAPWGVTDDLNPGITLQTPQTLAGLDLTPTIAGHAAPVPLTVILNSAAGPQTQTDGLLGATGSLRWPRYGNTCAIVNQAGKNQNANSLSQTMIVVAGDVDPADGQVHVRLVVAPVLENPAHPANEQPYFYIQLTNITRGNAVLYTNFNFSNQSGVPWIVDNTNGTTYDYTDWQVVDIAPGSPAINQGDTVRLDVIASGCSLGGHEGEIYVGYVGSTLPGIYLSGTGPSQANPGTYNITYKNGSAGAETGVVIDFTTPPGTTFQSFTPPVGATCVAPAVGTAGTIVCTFTGPVPASGTGGFTVTVKITPGAACTTTANCNTAAGQVCDTDAGVCVEGQTGVACTTTANCGAGQTCDVGAGLCTYGEIIAGTYQISSTQETPILGSKITTLVGCTLDSQCPTGDWCDESADACKPTLGNGTAVPSDPPHTGPALNGTCTAAAGALVCTSGVCATTNNECGYSNSEGPCTVGNETVICQSDVCDATDNKCGYANGDGPCTVTNGPTVCRSATCSVSGTCEPVGGCNVDADCATGKWCDESTHTCTLDLTNGAPVPTDPAHTTPTLDGICTAAAGTLVCVSGVCDTKDNDCGYANSDGPCTATNGATVCRSAVCDPDGDCGYKNGDGPCTTTNAGTVCRSGACSTDGNCEPPGGCEVDADCATGNWCDETTETCTPTLANGVAVPTDGPHTNPTLNGTCTAAAGALVCTSGVCDATDNECGYANGDGPCTTTDGPTDCRSGVCSATAGVCIPATGGCVVDADCSATQYCDTPTFTCVTKVPNGQAVPTVAGHSPTLNGACTAAAGTAACASGVCDTKDNECGYANGDGPCTATDGATDCRSGACSTSGTCEPSGGCNVDADCAGGKWCNETMHACVPQLANGTPVPTDTNHTSPTLNGTCTAAAGALVCSSGVCDVHDNECGYADGDGPCTAADGATDCRSTLCATSGSQAGLCVACLTSSQCSGATPTCGASGTCVECATSSQCPSDAPNCSAAGMCTTTCMTDANCPTSDWCDITSGSSGLCTPKIANGKPLPTTPTSVATCTAAVGKRVCVSGVCDTKDNDCGPAPDAGTPDAGTSDASMPDAAIGLLPLGATCTLSPECQSQDCVGGICSEIVSSGSGVFCAVRTVGSTSGEPRESWGAFGFMVGLAGLGVGRRRRSRTAKAP
jgi:hypothetical protein